MKNVKKIYSQKQPIIYMPYFAQPAQYQYHYQQPMQFIPN
jgi:hypothetical protein